MKKTMLAVLSCILMLFPITVFACSGETQPPSMERHTGGSLSYWLYTPEDTTSATPLIVYLHGGSGKGDDLDLLMEQDGFPKWLSEGRLGQVPAYVLIPQLPADAKDWASAGTSVAGLIQEIAGTCPIDPANISLTGHSLGGTGTFALAQAYPDLFARIAPCSGSVRVTEESLSALADVSVWAFVGSADTVVPPQPSIHLVESLSRTGDARLTELEGASHFDVPALVYLDRGAELIQWLTGGSPS